MCCGETKKIVLLLLNEFYNILLKETKLLDVISLTQKYTKISEEENDQPSSSK